MTKDAVDAKAFWDGKILGWERDRYGAEGAAGSALERVASRASTSIRFRLAFAGAWLAERCAGRRVVELGCGSGLLAEDLIAARAASYRGFDIAPAAVEAAEARIRRAGLDGRAAFAQARIAALPRLDADIVFSLGLLDWLDLDEIDHLFAVSGKAAFLHSISERRASIKQWLHKAYVHLAYGHRTGAYVPKYFAVDEIAAIARRHGHAEMYVYRDRRLSFGALLSSTPFEPAG